MKVLHLADLHIGKKVNGYSMIENQKDIFQQIYSCIIEKKVDVVLIVGDIYDRSIPSEEAIEVFDNFINELINNLKVKVVAISGNHDSATRLEFSKKILANQGFYILGEYKEIVNKVSIGEVDFYLMPFVNPSTIRNKFSRELAEKNIEIKTFDDTMKFIIDKIYVGMNFSKINIALYHGFVVGGGEIEKKLEKEESVKVLAVGGKESVSDKYFSKFDYTALGHLHGNRKVNGENIRYCGSPIKYSFSEKNQKKVLTIIKIDEKKEKNIEIEFVELLDKFPMIEVKGTLEEVLELNIQTDAYLKVILTEHATDAMNKLRSKYSQIMELEFNIENGEIIESQLTSSQLKEIKIDELFEKFAQSVGVDLDIEDKREVEKIMNNLLNEVK
ncbi:MAG: exonuclease SbcCD subunit D [Fusobacteriaceae bacterium]